MMASSRPKVLDVPVQYSADGLWFYRWHPLWKDTPENREQHANHLWMQVGCGWAMPILGRHPSPMDCWLLRDASHQV